ncbi:MAG: hypothetical protein HC904_16030 [Blastochloris sp.]|nr:hypothetical protein [Blastochloris sp.]
MLDFIHSAARGIQRGGFHTPNHRWVISSALAKAWQTWPHMENPEPCLESYLKEGLDIDAEGVWSERSAAIYDGVSDCAMLLLHEVLGREDFLQAARMNLDFNSAMLQPNGTIETAMSTRQDQGQEIFPHQLGAAFYGWPASPIRIFICLPPKPFFKGMKAAWWAAFGQFMC